MIFGGVNTRYRNGRFYLLWKLEVWKILPAVEVGKFTFHSTLYPADGYFRDPEGGH